MTAAVGTADVFVVMASLATFDQTRFVGHGQMAVHGRAGAALGLGDQYFVGSTVNVLAISTAAIGIFSAYMLYDIKQIIDGGETNYISATLALYLDDATCSKVCWPCWASSAAGTLRT